jgi:hypothetical protein
MSIIFFGSGSTQKHNLMATEFFSFTIAQTIVKCTKNIKIKTSVLAGMTTYIHSFIIPSSECGIIRP